MQDAAQSAAESAKNAAIEVAKKTQEELDRVSAATKGAVSEVLTDTRQAGQEAAEKLREAFEGGAAAFKDNTQIEDQMNKQAKKVSEN